jgi:transcriptional regulator with XRE-family HTH domain
MDYRAITKAITTATDLTAIQIAEAIGASRHELHAARYSGGHLNPVQIEALDRFHADAMLNIEDRTSVEETIRRVQIKHDMTVSQIVELLGINRNTSRSSVGAHHLKALLELEGKAGIMPGPSPSPAKPPQALKDSVKGSLSQRAKTSTLIKETLAAYGITQAQLAEHLGVSATAMSRWCSGRQMPNESHTRAIMDFKGLPEPKHAEMPEVPQTRLEQMLEAARQLEAIHAKLRELDMTPEELFAWYTTHKKITRG